MMDARVKKERKYWNELAQDKDVEKKIADKETGSRKCVNAIYPYIKDAKSVLEIGCGIGRLTIPMARKMKKATFTAIDISDEMIHKAAEKTNKAKLKNIDFRKTDGRHLPKSMQVPDAVYSMTTFQHITPDGVKGYINQVGELLKKGGVFRFQFATGKDHVDFSQNYTVKQMKGWCKDAGLNVTHIDKGLIYKVWTWITAEKK